MVWDAHKHLGLKQRKIKYFISNLKKKNLSVSTLKFNSALTLYIALSTWILFNFNTVHHTSSRIIKFRTKV